ncbi:MAG: DUF805 domain-containing protein [Sphingomicrobium sp.]
MTPVEWAKRPLQKYAEFTGRASRPEYWWFVLAQIVVMLVAMFLDSMLGTDFGGSGYGLIYLVVALGLLVPAIAVGIRRLHDTDRSGWWLLIALVPFVGAIILIVFLASEGTSGDNQYGPPPVAG